MKVGSAINAKLKLSEKDGMYRSDRLPSRREKYKIQAPNKDFTTGSPTDNILQTIDGRNLVINNIINSEYFVMKLITYTINKLQEKAKFYKSKYVGT